MKTYAWGGLLLLLSTLPALAAGKPAPLVLGDSTAALNGPWKFHTGDDPRWANPDFDDSTWESVDLSAPADANDGDVGIAPYTSGWTAKGHPGYQGYAWYRLRLTVTPPAGETLALLGPWAVDSSYQIYANAKLLGGVGDFAGAIPSAHGFHYPRYFELPPEMRQGGVLTLAIRAWMGPWAAAGLGAGGIHVAPVVGTREAAAARYRLQWLTIFEGYAVDVVPALMFFAMAVVALCLWPLDRGNRAYPWLVAALLLSGIQRGNQAFFFWWEVETVQGFVFFIIAFVASMSLAAWIMAWRAWFTLAKPAWLPKLLAVLTLLLMLAQVLARPWLFDAVFPHPLSLGLRYLITWARVAFLLAFVFTLYQGARSGGRRGWRALPAMLAIGGVLFAQELTLLHVPGIWFPYGIGLSLSEILSAVFNVLLFALLFSRLWSRSSTSSISHLESPA